VAPRLGHIIGHRPSAILSIAIALAVGCSKPSIAPPSPDAGAGLHRLELRGNVMVFDGRTLRFNDRLETWKSVLGAPTPVYGTSGLARWDELGITCAGAITPDGRGYVSTATVRIGPDGFPGVFLLQEVPLLREGTPFKKVQAALSGTDTPLVGLGRGRLPESAKMKVYAPDGFEVHVSVRLDCRPPGPDCVQYVEELELNATW
jgi:hypothetical protein